MVWRDILDRGRDHTNDIPPTKKSHKLLEVVLVFIFFQAFREIAYSLHFDYLLDVQKYKL